VGLPDPAFGQTITAVVVLKQVHPTHDTRTHRTHTTHTAHTRHTPLLDNGGGGWRCRARRSWSWGR
jgi:hypothetical protein